MTGSPRPDSASGRPVCVVTRLEFRHLLTSIAAALRFLRLRRVARRRIDGLLGTWMRWSPSSTVFIVSIWADENSLLAFTTLEEHVEAVRWAIRADGRVWSGVFELAGTSSMSEGWAGSIDRWRPRAWHDQEQVPQESNPADGDLPDRAALFMPERVKLPSARPQHREQRRRSFVTGKTAAARLAALGATFAIAIATGLAAGCDASQSVRAVSRICQVTLPNDWPPPAAAVSALPAVPPAFNGNGKLWVKLWPLGVIVASAGVVDRDGSIDIKVPWWREVAGALSVTGTRLDAKAPPLRADIFPGYGNTGFQPSSLNFPTEGCWRVTGRVGNTTLGFTTLVVRAAQNGY